MGEALVVNGQDTLTLGTISLWTR